MVKKETKPLTYDDVSKWPPVENVATAALDKQRLTPNQFAKDKKLTLDVCRKEIKNKKFQKPFIATEETRQEGKQKSEKTSSYMQQGRQEWDQIIAVQGWKAPQQVAFPDKEGNPQDISVLPGLEVANRLAFLLEQAVKRKKEDDRTSSPKDK